MVYFVKIVRFFVNYVIFHELCYLMRSEADCAKLHHHVISEGLISYLIQTAAKGIVKGFCWWPYG